MQAIRRHVSEHVVGYVGQDVGVRVQAAVIVQATRRGMGEDAYQVPPVCAHGEFGQGWGWGKGRGQDQD